MRMTLASYKAALDTVSADRDALLQLNASLEARLYEQQDASTIASIQLKAAQAENTQLRSLNANWAHQSHVDARTIARLKAHQPRMPSVTVSDFRTRCAEYCAQNGVRSVPADVVREWRNNA